MSLEGPHEPVCDATDYKRNAGLSRGFRELRWNVEEKVISGGTMTGEVVAKGENRRMPVSVQTDLTSRSGQVTSELNRTTDTKDLSSGRACGP